MRDRVLELEASNANLREAYYAMYHGVDPYVPPGPAGVQPGAIVADADKESSIHPNSSHAFFTKEDAFADEPVIDEPMEGDD
jgi:hypothetical protein